MVIKGRVIKAEGGERQVGVVVRSQIRSLAFIKM